MSSKKWSIEDAVSQLGYAHYFNSDNPETPEQPVKGPVELTQW